MSGKYFSHGIAYVLKRHLICIIWQNLNYNMIEVNIISWTVCCDVDTAALKYFYWVVWGMQWEVGCRISWCLCLPCADAIVYPVPIFHNNSRLVIEKLRSSVGHLCTSAHMYTLSFLVHWFPFPEIFLRSPRFLLYSIDDLSSCPCSYV